MNNQNNYLKINEKLNSTCMIFTISNVNLAARSSMQNVTDIGQTSIFQNICGLKLLRHEG